MYAAYMEQCDIVPKVSVLMGVYYHKKTLELLQRSIQSILEQSFSNFEFLICDNGSSEAARLCIRSFAAKDPRIRIIERSDLFTLSAKLNACLRKAKGSFIARMDDDDVSDPERLAVQMEYLLMHPEIAFVGCVARQERERRQVRLRLLPEKPTVRDFYMTQPFLHPTLLFRRAVLEAVGGYSEEPRCVGCEDYDLLLRLYETGNRGENIQRPLFTYTLPPLDSKKRTMALRWNEVKTRYVRFRTLGLLPETLPYIIKPALVGLMPNKLLERLKKIYGDR